MPVAMHADENRPVQPGPVCGMVAMGVECGKGGFGARGAR
jgi:hypothetical protein